MKIYLFFRKKMYVLGQGKSFLFWAKIHSVTPCAMPPRTHVCNCRVYKPDQFICKNPRFEESPEFEIGLDDDNDMGSGGRRSKNISNPGRESNKFACSRKDIHEIQKFECMKTCRILARGSFIWYIKKLDNDTKIKPQLLSSKTKSQLSLLTLFHTWNSPLTPGSLKVMLVFKSSVAWPCPCSAHGPNANHRWPDLVLVRLTAPIQIIGGLTLSLLGSRPQFKSSVAWSCPCSAHGRLSKCGDLGRIFSMEEKVLPWDTN